MVYFEYISYKISMTLFPNLEIVNFYIYSFRLETPILVVVLIFFYFFIHKLVYLSYRGIIVSFSQGGVGVPCPPFSVSAAPLCCRLPSLPLVDGVGGQVYAGEWGVWGSGLVCGSPGLLTWRGLALRHPPTGAAAHCSSALAPGILVCSCGWRAPKWSQSYSWRIHTS